MLLSIGPLELSILVNYWNYYSNELKLRDAVRVVRPRHILEVCRAKSSTGIMVLLRAGLGPLIPQKHVSMVK